MAYIGHFCNLYIRHISYKMNGTNIWCEMDLSISKLMCVCITQFVIYNLQFKSNFANRADFVLYDKVLSYIKQFASNFGFKLNIKQHCLFKQCNLLNSSNRYAHHLIYIWSLTGVLREWVVWWIGGWYMHSWYRTMF